MRLFLLNSSRFVVLFLVFIITPIILISTFDNLDKSSSNNSNITSLQLKSKYDSLDILFIGNSYCYSGIQPNLLEKNGIKSYNLGIATAGVDFYKLIINDYLAYVHQKPETIFILLSPMTFSSKADNFELYPIHRYLESPISHLELVKGKKELSMLFPLYKKSLKKGIINIVSNAQSSLQDRSEIDLKGFIESDSTYSKEVENHTQHLYRGLFEDEFDFKKIDMLLQIVDSLKSKGITIILFELPTNILNKFFNPNYLKDFNTAKLDIQDKCTIIQVPSNLFSSSNYRNIDHLNTSGSIIATNEIQRLYTNLLPK